MKNRIIYKLGIFILVAMVFSSCEKWIDTDINVDPDAPAAVSMDLIMPVIQARVGFNIVGGNDVARTQAIWMQYYTGVARQSQSEGSYILRAGDVNNLWGDVYAGALMDIKQLHALSAGGSPHMDGAADVLQAIVLGAATDVWGDIPYSDALQGTANIKPAFDTQQEIYVAIQSLLDGAIGNLSEANSTFPLDGDIIYGGDRALWIKAAYALKARYALHLSKRNGNSAYVEALSYLDNAISMNLENMAYYYNSNDYTNGNPAWLFQEDRGGDAVMGYFFIEKLRELNDPRLPQYALPIEEEIVYDDVIYPVGDYFGSPAGEPVAGSSLPGPAIAGSDTPTPIITYAEVLFIRAECEYQTGAAEAVVKATLKAAVAASLEQYGVMDQAWLDNLETTWGSGDDLFKEIMMQKYLALGYQTETFVDFRRTDNVIGLEVNPESSSNVFPRRYPYATDPVTYNPNTPANVDIFQSVWWDN